jgi:hypothetical protein
LRLCVPCHRHRLHRIAGLQTPNCSSGKDELATPAWLGTAASALAFNPPACVACRFPSSGVVPSLRT